MFLHVREARHIANYRVYVSFSDGTSAEIDLADSLDGPIFEPLRDVEYFKSFSIIGHTLSWPNGADFAPEYLYSLASTSAKT
jgi:hypothetical protein